MSLVGVEGFESVLRRLGDGSSGEGDAREVGEVLAARCMNFIVNSLEDIIFGALPGVLAAAMMERRKISVRWKRGERDACVVSCSTCRAYCSGAESDVNQMLRKLDL